MSKNGVINNKYSESSVNSTIFVTSSQVVTEKSIGLYVGRNYNFTTNVLAGNSLYGILQL